MLKSLEIFGMANGLIAHANSRQSTIARNVANSDTPDYKAKDVASFADTYQPSHEAQTIRATRPKHLLGAQDRLNIPQEFVEDLPNSPNGNSVSLEGEMMKSGEVRHQHDMALSIYSTSLSILRSSIGRG